MGLGWLKTHSYAIEFLAVLLSSFSLSGGKMTAAQVGFFVGSLIPAFLLSRLTLFLLKRWRGGYLRLFCAHIGSLGLCGLVGGVGFAGPGESFVFDKGVAMYALPQLVCFLADCWRLRRKKPEVLAAAPLVSPRIEPSLKEDTPINAATANPGVAQVQQGSNQNEQVSGSPTQQPLPSRTAEASWFGRTYLGRHWRGELSLPISYWINGFLGAVGIIAIALLLSNFVQADNTFDPRAALAVLVAYWVSASIIVCWQTVGVWRSADRYAGRGGSKWWAGLAKLMIVLGVLRFAESWSDQAAPQIREYTDIVFRGDPRVGPHTLRVVRDGTELEFTGGISFGVTQEIRTVLDASPGVRVIHLDSQGGRVLEARRLRDLIRERELVTVTSSQCVSACVLAFLGGKERYLAPGAHLGFHTESFPGTTPDQAAAIEQEDGQFMMSLGIPREFVSQAFSTPSKDVWYPTVEELKAANVITDESAKFAIGGLENEATLDQVLSASFLVALKDADPAQYQSVRARVLKAAQGGLTQAELTALVSTLVGPLLQQYLPRASDALAIEFTKTLTTNLIKLGQEDPEACYAWMFPNKAPPGFDLATYLDKQDMQRINDLLARVIADGAIRNSLRPTAESIARAQAEVVQKLQLKDGQQVAVLAQPDSPTANHAMVCKVITDMYETVLMLPAVQQGPLIRYLLASQ